MCLEACIAVLFLHVSFSVCTRTSPTRHRETPKYHLYFSLYTFFFTEVFVVMLQDAGKSTGVVTTTRITHASPAGTYAHTANRDWENDAEIRNSGQDPDNCDDIAEQLVNKLPGKNINVSIYHWSMVFLTSISLLRSLTNLRVYCKQCLDRNSSSKMHIQILRSQTTRET